MDSFPPSVNWHLWPWCNFRCGYCFQPPVPGMRPLQRDVALKVPGLLARAGAEKLTFVGGEPTLCPHLPDLVTEAKRVGLTTMLVTNGSRLSVADVRRLSDTLDWLCVSIDSFDARRSCEIGRGGERSTPHAVELLREAKRVGMRTKVNTVVNALNWNEKMRAGILDVAPDRWKVFRFLHVPGTNDAARDRFFVSETKWAAFREAHRGLGAVFEDNDDMQGSYVMLDASGQFFQSTPNGYVRSEPILEVGVVRAFEQIPWDKQRFTARGGLYTWTR